MKLLRGLRQQSTLEKGSVATIGNFDGVHVGHQSIVRHVVQKAKDMGIPSVVILFEPQPQEFFAPDKAPARIMRFREKYQYLESLGVDYLLCLAFNRQLAELSAEDFVEQVLSRRLNVKHLIVGDDFTFGRERRGNFEFLETWGKNIGFSVQDTASVLIANERVSSTLIRQSLAESDFISAEKMLGRSFEFNGKVCYGQQLGRQWGVPTINLPIARKKTPIHGIFIVEIRIEGDPRLYQGVSSLGTRPTVNGKGILLEVHLFDFDRMIYGSKVKVRPLKKVRNEQKFPDVESLKARIFEDIKIAREYFEAQK
jgi:riboflavin kinase / FMN adenylyltransferase